MKKLKKMFSKLSARIANLIFYSPEPRRFYIPKNRVAKTLQLLDDVYRCRDGQHHVARYLLWNYIATFIPQIREDGTKWHINTERALRPYVEEYFDEN